MADEFTPVALSFGNYIKFDDTQVGKTYVGEYIKSEEKNVNGDTFTDHHVKLDDGTVTKMSGNISLNTFFESLEAGTRFQIKYNGKKKVGSRMAHNFDFAVAAKAAATTSAAKVFQ
jgi:hypothetical protein